MVRVITIMDDVYVELSRLKREKGMSFTGAIRHLLSEREKKTTDIISFAGSIGEDDLDLRAIESAKKTMHIARRAF